MKVKDVMTSKVIKAQVGSTLGQIAKLLVNNKISGAPVVDKDNKLKGVISEKDIFSAMYPNFKDIVGDITAWFDNEKREYKLNAKKEIIIDSIMTPKAVTISPEDSVLEAGGKMIANQIHRLIVTKGKKIVGVVTRGDVFKKILKKDLNIK